MRIAHTNMSAQDTYAMLSTAGIPQTAITRGMVQAERNGNGSAGNAELSTFGYATDATHFGPDTALYTVRW